eukprot:5663722-Lingulodinium_polyedra.AAC.1
MDMDSLPKYCDVILPFPVVFVCVSCLGEADSHPGAVRVDVVVGRAFFCLFVLLFVFAPVLSLCHLSKRRAVSAGRPQEFTK